MMTVLVSYNLMLYNDEIIYISFIRNVTFRLQKKQINIDRKQEGAIKAPSIQNYFI